MSRARTAALVLAAGRGERLGARLSAPGPKALVPLAGRPLLAWSLETLGACPAVDEVVIVGDEAALAPALDGLSEPARGKIVAHVAGGPTREESCALGLAAVPDGAEVILVHDAARPFARGSLFAAVAEAAWRAGAAIAAVPLADTLKRGAGGRVLETLPREGLWRAQTPQGFRAELFRQAHAAAARERTPVPGCAPVGALGTDDATLVERLGHTVEIVPGDIANLKITTPEDLAWAEAWLAAEGARGRP